MASEPCSPGGLGGRLPVALELCFALLAACGEPAGPAPRYALVDVAGAAGLSMTLTSGRTPSTQLLEVKGGGLALIDYDGDGDLDVFAPNGATLDRPRSGPGCRLFENLGELRFRDATSEAGLAFRRWGFGCAVGDVDADGVDDLFVACYGRNALFRGRGDGTFEEISEGAGFSREHWSAAASFGDLDGDGDLDLYVANYVVFDPAQPPAPQEFRGARVFGGPMGLPGEPDEVYENLGGGTFRDVTEAWGFADAQPSHGLGVVVLDLDGDGSQEVFVGNDSQGNFLFRRGDDGRFAELGLASGLAFDEHGWGQATMGIAVGDVDGDGLPDLFTSNFMSDLNTLHVNLGRLHFDDQTRRYGLGAQSLAYLGWACFFLDLDQDGSEELLVFNGHVYSEAVTEPMGWRHAQEPLLFERAGDRYARVPPEAGGPWLAAAHCDRSAAFGDLDGDGDLDAVVGELNGPLRLLRNDGAAGHWLRVVLADRRPGAGNPRGLGARVCLRGANGTQYRWIVSGPSYQAASAPEAHFGLGGGAGPVDLEVRWPDGHLQRVEVMAVDRVLEVPRR